ncbi:MAG: AraC family transcriptional regulator [Panacibacter sp.]
MIKIEYNLTSYQDTIRYFAKCLQLKVIDNGIEFTPDKGKGTIRLISLLNGLQVMVYDYTIFQDLLFHRKKTDKEFFVLRLDETMGNDGITRSSVFFGKTSQEWFYMASAHNHLRHVNVIMSKEWLDTYFENEDAGEMLTSHITLKSPLMVYEVMDTEYKRLMSELMYIQADSYFEQMIVQNRVMLILERFFTKLFKSIENENSGVKISSRELHALKSVEQELLKDFSEPPPAIAQLARIAAMSPSKMKILFKEVFELPVNQYYQKYRMNKAKAMLLSRKYSVRATAYALNFSSVSSFNKAFFKAFEQMPADIAIPENK